MVGPGQRAVGDAVLVDVAVAGPLAGHLLEIVLRQHLSAVERFLRVLELRRHPQVHAEVEVGEHKDRRLESVRVVECVARELVALLDRPGQQDDVLRVAMRQRVDEPDVGLRRARRKTSRGADALDVEDHDRDFGVVGETGELSHQRDAWPGGGRECSSARPAGTDRHPDRRQLVLGLDHRDQLLAGLRVDAEPVRVSDEVLAQ